MIYINKFAEMNANPEITLNGDSAQDFKETFQPFLENVLILYQRFSGVFCWCKMETLTWNGLKSLQKALRKFSFLLLCGFTGHHNQASSYFYRHLEAVIRRCSSKQVFLQGCNFIKNKVQHSFFFTVNTAKFLRTAFLQNTSGGRFRTYSCFQQQGEVILYQ